LLETLELAIRETQNSDALILAAQEAGDLSQAQDALRDDKRQHLTSYQPGRCGFQERNSSCFSSSCRSSS
jgi:hypothetical protein